MLVNFQYIIIILLGSNFLSLLLHRSRHCCLARWLGHPRVVPALASVYLKYLLLINFIVLGISEGLVVSSALPNSYELVVSFLATSWQRGIAAPLNPGYKQEEFEFYIDDIDVTLVLVPRDSYEKGGPVVAAAVRRGAAIAECYWDGEKVTLDVKKKGRLAGKESQDFATAQAEDVALILHTSGTTAAPKAVRLSCDFLCA